MRAMYLFAFALFATIASKAQEKEVPVFVSGTDGYKSYRIPAIIRAPDGDLLAFCEGRRNGASDFGNIQVVMKRSHDNGLTWEKLTIVASNDSLQADNAAPVVDMTDPAYPKGRIFLFYNTGNVSESLIRSGKGVREVWYRTSVDNGITWSAPVNITRQVHPPGWRSFANTPGHSIQLKSGRYKGRLYIAANHTSSQPQPHYADGRAFGYYSDDHGKTFKISEDVTMPGGNEVMAVELSHSKVMLNIRNQKGDVRQRIIAVSSDGGKKWDTAYFDKNLPDPVCQGSVLDIGRHHGKTIVAVCNDAATHHRDSLTVRISYDEGRSWRDSCGIAIAPAGYRGDYSAYSDLVNLSSSMIGILYEKENYSKIVFRPLKWTEKP